jgi:guanine nucleotide-binding protein subunit gamma 1/2, plant
MRGEANGEEAQQQPHPVRGEEEEDDDDERQQPDQGPPQQRQHGHAQRTASRPSSGQQQQPPVAMRSVGYVGKHRLSAAIARLDQELQSLQVRASLSPVSTETQPLLSHGSVPVLN